MNTTTRSTLTLGIDGMTCGSCRRRVEAALAGVPGVHAAVVDLDRGSAEVRYDPAVASPTALAAAIRRAGYEVAAPGRREPGTGSCGCGCGH